MTVQAVDQPIDKLREAVIDQLVMNYGHDKLSLEAFDRRLEQAMDAKTHAELLALTTDLELKVDQEYIDKKHAEFCSDFVGQRKDVEYIINVLGGSNRRGDWHVAKEIRMINILGGGELDFSDAIFPSGITTIKLFCVLGGASIYVPEGVRVKTRLFSFLGGFKDRAPSSNLPNAPTLIIEGLMLLGGADVKVKFNFKQRLVEFGNSIRSFFSTEKP